MTSPDLIERLEKAVEGSRELDAAIARHLAGYPKDHWFNFLGTWSTADTVPALTTSLDAALAQAERVLPGWSAWELRSAGGKSRYVAEFSRLQRETREEQWATGRASRPALALCAAILKAHSTREEEG